MRIKWIICCLAVFFCTNAALAQQTTNTSLQYSVAIPTGGLKDYAGEVSLRGIEFGYHYLLTPEVGLGFNAGLNTFYEEERGTFVEGTSATTGTQFRYANLIPLLASFTYYLKPDQALNPYLNLGIGALHARLDTDIGVYRTEMKTWQFNLKPEIGVIYSINPGLGIKISGKYHQAFESDELDAQSYASLGIGVVFSGNGR